MAISVVFYCDGYKFASYDTLVFFKFGAVETAPMRFPRIFIKMSFNIPLC